MTQKNFFSTPDLTIDWINFVTHFLGLKKIWKKNIWRRAKVFHKILGRASTSLNDLSPAKVENHNLGWVNYFWIELKPTCPLKMSCSHFTGYLDWLWSCHTTFFRAWSFQKLVSKSGLLHIKVVYGNSQVAHLRRNFENLLRLIRCRRKLKKLCTALYKSVINFLRHCIQLM